MVKITIHLCCTLLILNSQGCGNFSGGGSTHTPPTKVIVGKPLELKLNFSSSGEETDFLVRRISNVVCKFRSEQSAKSGSIPGSIDPKTIDQLGYEFSIPTDGMISGEFLTYQFEFDFDGISNQRQGGTIHCVKE